MQPVQDITVDDRVSRTQYQYTLEDADPDELDDLDRPLRRAAEGAARARGRRDRSADRRARRVADHRPRHRVAARHRAVDHRQHALRRVRPAPDQHDVHAGEPVPRDPRGRAASSRQDPNKLDKLYIQANASAGATGTGAATSFASSGSPSAGSNTLTDLGALYARRRTICSRAPNALSRPSATDDARAPSPLRRDDELDAEQRGAAQRLRALRADHRAARHHPPGAVPGRSRSRSTSRPARSLGAAITAIDDVQQDLHMPAERAGAASRARPRVHAARSRTSRS